MFLGSVGYAQVGQDDYFKKEKVESAVLVDLIINNSIFKIPDEFLSNCFFKIKKISTWFWFLQRIMFDLQSRFFWWFRRWWRIEWKILELGKWNGMFWL